jgi:type VI secretion system FHA domain protein
MVTFGRIVREMTDGLIKVLSARSQFKHELRLEMTTVRPVENNPLKFSVDVDEALHHLLLPRAKGYLPPLEAVHEAFDDIQAHEMAIMAGLHAALAAMLGRFDPKQLEDNFKQRSVLDNLLPIARKAKYWDIFTEIYQDIAKDAAEGFLQLFSDEFTRAYEEQVQKLKAARIRQRR